MASRGNSRQGLRVPQVPHIVELSLLDSSEAADSTRKLFSSGKHCDLGAAGWPVTILRNRVLSVSDTANGK